MTARPNKEDELRCAEELRAHYDSVRARLGAGSARPQSRAGNAASSTPSPSPSAFPDGLSGAADEGLRDLPVEIRDVVRSISAALHLAPRDMLSNLDGKASLGRRMAASLVVRRSLLAASVTARLFGMAEAVVVNALVTLDAVLAFTQASATHAPLDPLARQVAAEWARFEETTSRRIPIGEVVQTVARVFDVSVDDMKSARRTDGIVRPRHVAMYLAKRFTLRSMPDIARAFGGRDHTTVVHAVKKMSPIADAVALKLGGAASLEEWARALRDEMQ